MQRLLKERQQLQCTLPQKWTSIEKTRGEESLTADVMTVWLPGAKLRELQKHYFKLEMLHKFIHNMNVCHRHWDPHYKTLLDICFSPNAEENRPSSVSSSRTLSLLPRGSFWRRQTRVLLMVQGTVCENTSWIMERTVHVLQKAIVRQGCLTPASVPFKNGLEGSAQFRIQRWCVPSLLCNQDFLKVK